MFKRTRHTINRCQGRAKGAPPWTSPNKVSKNDIYTLMVTVEALYKVQEMGMLHGIKQELLVRQVQQYKKRLAHPE